MMKRSRTDKLKSGPTGLVLAAFLLALLAPARAAYAYIGPGAGFAFLSSFLIFFIAFFLAAGVFITSPIRLLFRALRRRRAQRQSRHPRVVILGLDGLSPVLAERLMKQGRLPNFSQLAKEGTFRRLRSTVPSASPVAWSTFQTGANPGKHNIFDFLSRDRRTYMPDLSSARIEPPKRTIKLGKYVIPLSKPRISLRRKSQPFWKILGEHGIFSIVLRVPITFPPEKFRGVMLSGMCVPDLRGTQGSFTYFTTETAGDGKHTGGMRIVVPRQGDRITGAIPGPTNPMKPADGPIQVPFTVRLDESNGSAKLQLPGEEVELKLGEYSPWVRLHFRAGLGVKVSGICRFSLREVSPDFKLYLTPIHIDPEKPSVPISHPFVYAPYLAKRFGPYATLGLAEDTWALNERVIDEGAFVEQAYAIHEEREKMFFDALGKVDQGLVVCVFDTTDRLQHMFWQYTPEARALGSRPDESPYDQTVEELYERMDEMLGRVRAQLGKDDLLLVMSDHGFGSFQRCVNLNAWLKERGFLKLRDGAEECGDYFEHVDWSRTQAYAVGLGGIYINQAGREGQGVVRSGEEKRAVKQAIIEGLGALEDTERGTKAVSQMLDGERFYAGPYAENGPDLVVGFADGYRVSWDSVTGKFGSTVIDDNEKAWSGDHCVDPGLVPGVLFCNRPVNAEYPGIIDLAPTVLDAFGVPIPGYMDGAPVLSAEEIDRSAPDGAPDGAPDAGPDAEREEVS